MRRGFTLVEMMVACSLSAAVFAAVLAMMISCWNLVRNSTDELQCMLRLRNQRARLLYSASPEGYGGFLATSKVELSSTELKMTFPDKWESGNRQPRKSTIKYAYFDLNTGADAYHGKTQASQGVMTDMAGFAKYGVTYLFLKTTQGRCTAYDRATVCLFGHQGETGYGVTEDVIKGEKAIDTTRSNFVR